MEILKNPNYDFLGKTKILLTLSLLLALGGWAYIAKNGVRYGVEFSEGTQLIVKFTSTRWSTRWPPAPPSRPTTRPPRTSC
jgi:preprotein translocase subunit SecF